MTRFEWFTVAFITIQAVSNTAFLLITYVRIYR